MSRIIARIVIAAFVLLPALAVADPIKLKLTFYTSDRSYIYQNLVKPFIDAVNLDGRGVVEIETYFSGAITKMQAQQLELLANGTADFALITPGRNPDRFHNRMLMELPGLFRNSEEASRAFARLIAAGALDGYEDLYVVSAFVSGAESIHSRKPIASVEDLKNLTIRTNNQTEASVLERLGAIPVLLPINQTTEAVSSGSIDGATLPPSMLFEFGVGRVASNHFMIPLGGVPSALVMNRVKFESLPPPAQAVIRKYSGDWMIQRSVAGMDKLDGQVLDELKTDPRRKVMFPSNADMKVVQAAFGSVINEWIASSPRNGVLLARVKAEVSRLRGGE